MNVRERLEELQKQGWTLEDLINLIEEIDKITINKNVKLENMKTMEQLKEVPTVEDTIRQLGIPAHIKGHLYIIEAIKYCLKQMQEGKAFPQMTKEIYPKVAAEFNTTPPRVERAIRHGIELTWSRLGNEELIDLLFGSSIDPKKGKPTNSEFIASVVDYIRRKSK